MGIIRTLRRDVGSQFLKSRNLKEGLRLRSKRLFWSSAYLFKGLWWALLSIQDEQIGSEVIYRGKRCWVSNWAGTSLPTLSGDDFYESKCHRSEIRNITNLRELKHRFNSGFSHYMSSWYGIDINRKLYSDDY